MLWNGSIIICIDKQTIANGIRIRRRTERIMPMWTSTMQMVMEGGVADSSSADAPSLLLNFIEKSNISSWWYSIEISLLKLSADLFQRRRFG